MADTPKTTTNAVKADAVKAAPVTDAKADAKFDKAERAYADAAAGRVDLNRVAKAVETDKPAAKTGEVKVAAIAEAVKAPAGKTPVKAPAKKAAVQKTVAKKAAVKKAKPAKRAAPKILKPALKAAPKSASIKSLNQTKDTTMEKIENTSKDFTAQNYTASLSNVAADMQERMKAVYEKTTGMTGEMSEMAKGNVEAAVESGKVLTSGLQDMGRTAVEDAKSAYETMTADVKQMATIKNPSELMKLQGEMARRNFDTMIAQTSKNTEAMMKLMNEAFAPISNRISVAVEKTSKAA